MTSERKPAPEVYRPFPAEPTTARPCRLCGIPIAFGANRIPLDLTTLRPIGTGENPTPVRVTAYAPRPVPGSIAGAMKADKAAIDAGLIGWEARSHYQTCPHADRFRRQKGER